MSGVAAIGEEVRVRGFALAGADVHPADDAASARAAWESLGDDVTVVILTAASAAALADLVGATPGPPFPVVMPS